MAVFFLAVKTLKDNLLVSGTNNYLDAPKHSTIRIKNNYAVSDTDTVLSTILQGMIIVYFARQSIYVRNMLHPIEISEYVAKSMCHQEKRDSWTRRGSKNPEKTTVLSFIFKQVVNEQTKKLLFHAA